MYFFEFEWWYKVYWFIFDFEMKGEYDLVYVVNGYYEVFDG